MLMASTACGTISVATTRAPARSVNTILARVNVPSSRAICSTVSTITRLIASASSAGTVENAAVRLTSAMCPPYSPALAERHGSAGARSAGGLGGPWLGPPCSVSGRGGRAQVIEAGLQSLVGDPDPHGLGELERRERFFPGRDRVPAPPQRRHHLVADALVDQDVASLGVQPGRLHRGLKRAPPIDEGREHLGNGRDDAPASRRAQRQVRTS